MAKLEDFNKSSSQSSHEHTPRKDIISLIGNRIKEGVHRLEKESKGGLRAYHQAIVELDHVLLSNIATEKEEIEIVSQARISSISSRSQELYRPYETLLEESFVRIILGGPTVDFFSENNITHNYLMRYYNLAANEIRLAVINKDDRVLFIGSGPFPITAIEYARQTGCQVDCIERLPEKADTSRKVISHLGLDDQIQVYTTEGQVYPPNAYSVVLVGVLAQPKQDIIDNLEKNCRENTRILARTTNGLRQFIYPPAEFQIARFTLKGMIQATGDQALSTMLFI